jgi:hypothetical protein
MSSKKPDFGEVFMQRFIEAIILNVVPEHKEFYQKKPQQTSPESHPEKPSPHIISEFKAPHPPETTPPQSFASVPPISGHHPTKRNTQFQESIFPLIKDASILSIECPGPGKNLIVNKYGVIQTLPQTLSKEDINNLINDISRKTKIPLIQGIFKAAIGNLRISAVISEFVGTRFIIEKQRRPQQLRR